MWVNKQDQAPQTTTAYPPGTNPPKPAAPASKEAHPSPDPIRPLSGVSDRITARLGTGLQIKGEISGNEDLHIDGSVEGSIHLESGRVIVGASAKVSADVSARDVIVYGTVKGNLRARDRIEIKNNGSVIGDLSTARIMIEDGAYFKGAIEIEGKGKGDRDTNRPSLAAVAVKST